MDNLYCLHDDHPRFIIDVGRLLFCNGTCGPRPPLHPRPLANVFVAMHTPSGAGVRDPVYKGSHSRIIPVSSGCRLCPSTCLSKIFAWISACVANPLRFLADRVACIQRSWRGFGGNLAREYSRAYGLVPDGHTGAVWIFGWFLVGIRGGMTRARTAPVFGADHRCESTWLQPSKGQARRSIACASAPTGRVP